MVKAPIPPDERVRLQQLHEYGILDTPEEEGFNEIVQLASRICQVPVSLISLIDAERQWFKARIGIPEDMDHTPRDISFCGHAMLNGEIFVVPDAMKDERFHDNPLVKGQPNIRFYAGVPLVSPNGGRLGTLCVIDSKAHHDLGPDQKDILVSLGRQVVKLMELHKKNLELERVAEMQKRIISIIAHDIRSPLSSLKSLLQLIPEHKSAHSQPGALLDMAGNQLNATLSLLDNIVDWGQLQLKEDVVQMKDCFLNEIVREVEDDLKIQAEMKGLHLKNRIKKDIRFRSDENMVRFILRNLLTNAIKFTKSGHIAIDAAVSRHHLLITVEDTGIGMSPAILEQLFHGRKKISRKGTQNEAGSGLGLSLVKEFVEKMNGQITAESEAGRGTTLALSLPLAS